MTVGVVGGPSSLNDPALGQFLSPDTLVPDAGLVLDYNRYMYARGNPVKYTDPSGHIAVCFEGGPRMSASNVTVPEDDANPDVKLRGSSVCNAAYSSLSEAMRSKLGGIHFLYNGEASIRQAIRLIRDAKSANPDEPIVLMAYSWGGPVSFRVANALNYAGLDGNQQTYNVDLMLLLDPEFYARQKSSLFEPEQVSENVTRAVEYKAMFPTDGYNGILKSIQDGEPEIHNALHVELTGHIDILPGESLKMTHQTIVSTRAGHEMMKRYLRSELLMLFEQ